MSLFELGVLYVLVGGAAAIAIHRRGRSPRDRSGFEALITVLLWPLWAPIAWTARADVPERVASAGVVASVRDALAEGVQAAQGTPLEQLLNRDSAHGILCEVERLAARRHELLLLLSRQEFDPARAEARLLSLSDRGGSGRACASARLHLENVRRLGRLAERDERTLEELAGLSEALRTQLVYVKLSGASADGARDIVSELWTRIEGLSEASDEAFDLDPLESPA